MYLAYGLETTKYQVILSILTLYYQVGIDNKDFFFVIYTDEEHAILDKYLNGLPVKLEVLSKAIVKKFRGPDNYVFRVKSCVIQDFFEKYKRDVLYMDTDTFFTDNPVPLLKSISTGHTIMNVEEYDFADGGAVEPVHWYNLRQALKRHTYSINGEEVKIPIGSMMWNAGIIGLSYKDSGLVQNIIELTDEMYDRCKTFIVEQFTTSYILQTNTHLSSTRNYIDHYWPKEIKNSFNLRIPIFLKENGHKPKLELCEIAFAFAQEVRKIATPYREPIIDRVKLRLKLIMQVARKGYL
jgi:hypothetical protein